MVVIYVMVLWFTTWVNTTPLELANPRISLAPRSSKATHKFMYKQTQMKTAVNFLHFIFEPWWGCVHYLVAFYTCFIIMAWQNQQILWWPRPLQITVPVEGNSSTNSILQSSEDNSLQLALDFEIKFVTDLVLFSVAQRQRLNSRNTKFEEQIRPPGTI